MDYFFNKIIPKSTTTTIILRPSRKTFASGLAYKYCERYPKQLKNKITEEDFCEIIFSINDNIKYY
jgi:hypothetical protein